MTFSSLTSNEETTVKQNIANYLTKDTADQGEKSSYYSLYYDKTGTPVKHLSPRRETQQSSAIESEQITIFEDVNRLLRKVSDIVSTLVTVEDPIEQTNLAFTFKECLGDLWKSRNHKEDNWGDLINILQAVLAQVQFEQLSDAQKSGIKRVVSEYLCKAEITDSDMDDSLDVLSKAGFDPWCGISGNI